MRKAFKSSIIFDQQVVSRDTMPTAMLETYRQCDIPPPLDKLNVYRFVLKSIEIKHLLKRRYLNNILIYL